MRDDRRFKGVLIVDQEIVVAVSDVKVEESTAGVNKNAKTNHKLRHKKRSIQTFWTASPSILIRSK